MNVMCIGLFPISVTNTGISEEVLLHVQCHVIMIIIIPSFRTSASSIIVQWTPARLPPVSWSTNYWCTKFRDLGIIIL